MLCFYGRQVVKDTKVKARYHHLIANSFVEVSAYLTGIEIMPVYPSISGNFRKQQVNKIDACCWQQARETLIIQNLSI